MQSANVTLLSNQITWVTIVEILKTCDTAVTFEPLSFLIPGDLPPFAGLCQFLTCEINGIQCFGLCPIPVFLKEPPA